MALPLHRLSGMDKIDISLIVTLAITLASFALVMGGV